MGWLGARYVQYRVGGETRAMWGCYEAPHETKMGAMQVGMGAV